MRKLILWTVVLGLLACGAAFAQDLYHHYDGGNVIMEWDRYWADFDDTNSERWEYWYIHRALQIDRVGDSNIFNVGLLDTIYDGTIPHFGIEIEALTYLDIWSQIEDQINFAISDNPENLDLGVDPVAGQFGGDSRVEFVTDLIYQEASFEDGVIPLFSFEYTGTGNMFYIYDQNFQETQVGGYGFGRIPVPTRAPEAVPEPATLLGFGVPMLMVGLGRLRNLRK